MSGSVLISPIFYAQRLCGLETRKGGRLEGKGVISCVRPTRFYEVEEPLEF